jgi:hypothetical protein
MQFFAHYLLLVDSMFILLSDSISPESLDTAENQLHQFVCQFPSLYGTQNLTYNIHLLQHLSSTVRDWGPLWSTSNFMFESSNGFLLELFNGTQAISLQICNTFALYRTLPIFCAKYLKPENEEAVDFFNKCFMNCSILKRASRCSSDVVLLGVPRFKTLNAHEKQALEVAMPDIVPDQANVYHRAIVNGQLIHTQNYRLNMCRINYCVLFKDGSCGLVQSLVVVNDTCYACYIPVITNRHAFVSGDVVCHHIMSATLGSAAGLCASVARDITSKHLFVCFRATSGSRYYISPMPNSWELD